MPAIDWGATLVVGPSLVRPLPLCSGVIALSAVRDRGLQGSPSCDRQESKVAVICCVSLGSRGEQEPNLGTPLLRELGGTGVGELALRKHLKAGAPSAGEPSPHTHAPSTVRLKVQIVQHETKVLIRMASIS